MLRNIKPRNLLLTLDGHPELTDFGIAQVSDSEHSFTKTSSVLSTIAHMSPDQRMDCKSTAQVAGAAHQHHVLSLETAGPAPAAHRPGR